MRAALAIAVCAAGWSGCFSERGIAIEVDVGETGATTLELYVGNRACEASNPGGIRCDRGIAPPAAAQHLGGTIWFRDDEVPYRAEVKSGKATFRLQADDETTLPIAIVVGSGADGVVGTATLRDVVVPADSARVIALALASAGPVAPSTTAATEDRVQVWNEMTRGSSCVVVEHWERGTPTRQFIVPAEDPDCDDFVKESCDPAAWHAEKLNDGMDAEPACYREPAGGGVCKLGAFGCTDPDRQGDECLPTRDEVCVPTAFCGCMGADEDATCTAGKLASGGVPHLRCTLRSGLRGICEDQSGTIDLHGHFVESGCDQPRISALRLSSLASGKPTRTLGGIEVDLTSVGERCNFAMHVRGTHEPRSEEYGLISLTSDDHAVLLPVILQIGPPDDLCLPRPLDCQLENDNDPALWSCAP